MGDDKIQKKFDNILSDIKSIKIQGATNVCKAGIEAYLLKPDKTSIKKILKTRPTEPLLQNAIKFLSKSNNPKKDSIKFLKNLEDSKIKIAKFGASLIKNNMNIYSHCHSSTVMDILKYAKKIQKKNFTVYTTEVEPLLQGRLTAKDLSKAKIEVIIGSDLAANELMKKCDLFLFGADAYTKSLVVNKIGTSILCELAKINKVKSYSCGTYLKFTKKVKLEKRSSREVWDERNIKIKVINPAFDKTKTKKITGIISEFGILTGKQFAKKAEVNLKKL